MSLEALSSRASLFPIAQWGSSLSRETVRRVIYKPPLTKFLEDNGASLDIQAFLWLNKTTAFNLEAGTLVKLTTD